MVKRGAPSSGGAKVVDEICAENFGSSWNVIDDNSAKLNQTNIGGSSNNNKFYIIQAVQKGGKEFGAFNRWGRVGEFGAWKMEIFDSKEEAIKSFEKKFKDKTSNDWKNRAKFVKKAGKYQLLDVDETAVVESEPSPKRPKFNPFGTANPEKKFVPPSKNLPKELNEVLAIIFKKDMFEEEMKNVGVDVTRMPLGKLTKAQVKKGHDILNKIAKEMDKKKPSKPALENLTSEFYTNVPHDFGRMKPPTIDNQSTFDKEVKLINTLCDIEIAQSVERGAKDQDPMMDKYKALGNKMTVCKGGDKDFQLVSKYIQSTKCSYGGNYKLQNLFCLARDGEMSRSAAHKNITHRKLLWHGTSPAVVAAILKSGMRIMPHSGGRVGRGIYLASEHGKSSSYTRSTKGLDKKEYGFMFLCEAALGKESDLTRDDPRLTKAPNGYDSIVARGRTEPDPKQDTQIPSVISGQKVIVPQGKPINTRFNSTSFSQSEYLLYKESQVHMRYLCQISWR